MLAVLSGFWFFSEVLVFVTVHYNTVADAHDIIPHRNLTQTAVLSAKNTKLSAVLFPWTPLQNQQRIPCMGTFTCMCFIYI